MSKSISTIVEDVRVCMDEIGKNDSQFVGSTDDSELDVIIKSKIADAYNFVYENASIDLLGNASIKVLSTILDKTENVTRFAIDDELLRFVRAKMSSWNKAVLEPIGEDDPLYSAALDKYVGATSSRPAVLISREKVNNTIKYIISLVGKKTENETGEVMYIPRLSLSESATSIEISDLIYRAMVYYCAGLTYLTFNDKSRAQELTEMALVLMGANKDKEE